MISPGGGIRGAEPPHGRKATTATAGQGPGGIKRFRFNVLHSFLKSFLLFGAAPQDFHLGQGGVFGALAVGRQEGLDAAETAPEFGISAPERLLRVHIELARQVAIKAGYKPKFVVVTPYRDLFTGLVAGNFDMIAATTGITPKRQKIYLFSEPYFTTCQAAIVRKGDDEPIELSNLRDKPIAAPKGTSSIAAAQTLQPRTLLQVSGSSEGLAMLQTQVDAYICDEFEAVALAGENQRLTVLSEPVLLEQYGFVMRLDDLKLKKKIDTALQTLTTEQVPNKLRNRFGLNRPNDWPIKFSNSK